MGLKYDVVIPIIQVRVLIVGILRVCQVGGFSTNYYAVISILSKVSAV
jgi:hypothetical protein